MSGRVLVTGAGRRVGAGIARRLARDGWALALHCNATRTGADQLAAEIRSAGGAAEVVQADLTDQGAIDAMATALAARGDWVGLVNSAASFVRDDISDIAFAQATAQIQLNLIAPVYLARTLAAALAPGASGFVVNIADQKVLNPNPDYLSYTLAKTGLAHATGALAMALAPRVRVNCVAPGLMLPSGDQTKDQFERVHAATTLTQRGTRVEDLADAVAFLARADNITGALLPVDGGQHLVPSTRDVMFT
ncbi:MAG: SDR family oxidoreductase [Hyphomonadaceae bacterium]